MSAATVTCPVCGAVSAHPEDVQHGYCGACHDWTGDRENTRNDDEIDLE